MSNLTTWTVIKTYEEERLKLPATVKDLDDFVQRIATHGFNPEEIKEEDGYLIASFEINVRSSLP